LLLNAFFASLLNDYSSVLMQSPGCVPLSCQPDSTSFPKARKQKMLHSPQQTANLTWQKPVSKSNIRFSPNEYTKR